MRMMAVVVVGKTMLCAQYTKNESESSSQLGQLVGGPTREE